MPDSGRANDIFEYCEYVMGAFEFHKLLNMNFVLPASGLLQNGNEINCI